MLKQGYMAQKVQYQGPAAFGRLRVETSSFFCSSFFCWPAAFGRLRVETKGVMNDTGKAYDQPPSGGCVLKQLLKSR